MGDNTKYCGGCIHWTGYKCRAGYPTPKGSSTQAYAEYKPKK